MVVEGENNTSYFHAHAAVHRRRPKVVRLKDELGVWMDDSEELKRLAFLSRFAIYINISPLVHATFR